MKIFYAARLILLGESDNVTARRYEDDKIEIALKRTLFPDDTVVIWLKGLGGIRVYEIVLYPTIFDNKDDDQIFLRGHWEDYVLGTLLPAAKVKTQKRFRHKAEDFETWLENAGAAKCKIRSGTVTDDGIFCNNQPGD